MPDIRTHLGLVPAVVPLVIGFVVGLFPTAGLWREIGWIDLRDLVFEARQALPFAAPALGWLMVWVTDAHRPESVLVGPAPGRSRGDIVAGQILVSASLVTGGFLAGISPLWWYLALMQHSTVSDWISFAAVTVGLASLVPVAACGALLASRRLGLLFAPLAALAVVMAPTFLLGPLLAPLGEHRAAATYYMFDQSWPGRGEMLVPVTEAVRGVFFLLVALAATRLAVGLAEHRASGFRPRWRDVAPLGLPVLLGVAAMAVGLPMTAVDPGDTVACRQQSGLTVCLYAVDEPARDRVVAALEPLARLFPDQSFEFTQEQDRAEGRVLTLSRIGSDVTGRLEVEVRGAVADIVDEDLNACNAAEYESVIVTRAVVRQIFLRAADLAKNDDVRSIWLAADEAQESVSSDVDPGLDRLTDRGFAAWFEANRETIATCALRPGELP